MLNAAQLPAPDPLTAMVDDCIATFRALGPGHRISLSDHDGWLHVAVQTPDRDGPAAVARACEVLGAPPPEPAEASGYRWLRSRADRGPALTVSITGDWQVVRPVVQEGSDRP